MSDLIDTLEEYVGPLPKGRAVETAHVSTYRSALTGLPMVFEPPAAQFRAALVEAYTVIRRLAERTKKSEDEIRKLREMLDKIDKIVLDVPKTGDPDSAVMDIARVITDDILSSRDKEK